MKIGFEKVFPNHRNSQTGQPIGGGDKGQDTPFDRDAFLLDAFLKAGMDVIDASSNSCPIYTVSCRSKRLVSSSPDAKVCDIECEFRTSRGTVDDFVNKSIFKRVFQTTNTNADGDPFIETGSDGRSMGCPGQCSVAPNPPHQLNRGLRFDSFIPNGFNNPDLMRQIDEFLMNEHGAEVAR